MKIYGADLNPEGQDLINIKGRTSFNTRQPAILCIGWHNVVCICTSNFAIREPHPSRMPAVISSTSMRCREKCLPAIPSLTLWPAGLDRSRMRCHFPGWWRLGMTPKQLTWRTGSEGWEKSPPVCLYELLIASNDYLQLLKRFKECRSHIPVADFKEVL